MTSAAALFATAPSVMQCLRELDPDNSFANSNQCVNALSWRKLTVRRDTGIDLASYLGFSSPTQQRHRTRTVPLLSGAAYVTGSRRGQVALAFDLVSAREHAPPESFAGPESGAVKWGRSPTNPALAQLLVRRWELDAFACLPPCGWALATGRQFHPRPRRLLQVEPRCRNWFHAHPRGAAIQVRSIPAPFRSLPASRRLQRERSSRKPRESSCRAVATNVQVADPSRGLSGLRALWSPGVSSQHRPATRAAAASPGRWPADATCRSFICPRPSGAYKVPRY